MKFWLALLAPWMVATAALGQEASPVSVDYTHQGISSTDTFRIGEDCYTSPTVVRKWGWEVQTRYNDADITAEGRTIRVKMVVQNGRPVVSLTEAARYLGAKASWSNDKKIYRLRSWIRNVEATPTGVRIDGTLDFMPRAFKVTGPDRFVIDLVGAEYTPGSFTNLPEGWRVGQVSDNTVRFVVEHPLMAQQAVPTLSKGRSLETRISSLDAQSQVNPGGQPVPVTAVLAPALTVEQTSKELNLLIPVKSGMPGAPTARFITPRQIEITIPRAVPDDPIANGDLGTALITSYSFVAKADSAVLTLNCAKPMAFQMSAGPDGIAIKAFLPINSDGRLAGKIIVIDAGHGGHDTGAQSTGVKEKDLALKVAQQAVQHLLALGASVITTRNDDKFVGLGERSGIANRSDAALFVSIHINSNTVADSRSGSITFFHNQNPICMLLAQCIQTELAKVSKLPNIGIWSDQRIYQSGFAVLRGAQMPAVLVELGFINNSTDRKRLQEPEFQKAAGKAIAEGIRVYFGGAE
jgi:N-acetylmuramoyl-L-alanine amidase